MRVIRFGSKAVAEMGEIEEFPWSWLMERAPIKQPCLDSKIKEWLHRKPAQAEYLGNLGE